MSSTYGENLKLSIFGQSHGPAIGMTLDGIPAGLPIDKEQLFAFLDRRAPGRNVYSTTRAEADVPEFLSGVVDGFTCGAPIAAVIHNRNTRSDDYSNLKDQPRPGHADYTAQVKYGGFQDASGGGHFSGRLTAPLCIAGGLCKQWLSQMGIDIGAHVQSIGDIRDDSFDSINPDLQKVSADFPVQDAQKGQQMQALIAKTKSEGDSIGGKIQCAITGLPAGLGDPMFGGVENRIAQIVYGIPAVKGIQFGIPCQTCRGSEYNDTFYLDENTVRTKTNHCGGILGGITNGMPVIFEVSLKPTPSIARPQETLNLSTGDTSLLEIKGRHDPCIVPRAVPVVEAAAAIAIYDLILGNTQITRRN